MDLKHLKQPRHNSTPKCSTKTVPTTTSTKLVLNRPPSNQRQISKYGLGSTKDCSKK